MYIKYEQYNKFLAYLLVAYMTDWLPLLIQQKTNQTELDVFSDTAINNDLTTNKYIKSISVMRKSTVYNSNIAETPLLSH